MAAPLPVFVLNLHQDYRCRHAGACCTAGWDIPVDSVVCRRVAAAVGDGTLRMPAPLRAGTEGRPAFVHGSGLPHGAAAIVARTPSGDCVFFDRAGGNLCAIHSQLGHEWLPAACRHFPRVTLIGDTGVYVTLSHFCPTAAAMLLRDDVGRIEVVQDPPAFAGRECEGFDARGTVPPFLRPGVAFDHASRRAWDQLILRTCGQADWMPAQVLAAIVRAAEHLRGWLPDRGPLEARACALLGRHAFEHTETPTFDAARMAALFGLVAASVPDGLPRPALPASFGDATLAALTGLPARLATPVKRYLAARAFGAWCAYQGQGLRTEVAVLAAALAVLCVEAVRAASAAGRSLDAPLLVEALRAADRLTVHLSSSERLAQALAPVEHESAREFLARFGMMAG